MFTFELYSYVLNVNDLCDPNIIRFCFVCVWITYRLTSCLKILSGNDYSVTVNTHTRTSAACLEFLLMISFSLTFLSDYPSRKKTTKVNILLSHVWFNCTRTLMLNTHTLSLRASLSLSVTLHWCAFLCCCAVSSFSCPSLSVKRVIVSSKRLMLQRIEMFILVIVFHLKLK